MKPITRIALMIIALRYLIGQFAYAKSVNINTVMQPWEFKVSLPFTLNFPDNYESFYIPSHWGRVYWAARDDIARIERNGGLVESEKVKLPIFEMYIDNSVFFDATKKKFTNENEVLLLFNQERGMPVKDLGSAYYKTYKRFRIKEHEFFLMETDLSDKQNKAQYRILILSLDQQGHVWTVLYHNNVLTNEEIWQSFLTSFQSPSNTSAMLGTATPRQLSPMFKDSDIFRTDIPFAPIQTQLFPVIEPSISSTEERVVAQLAGKPHAQLSFTTIQKSTLSKVSFEYDRVLEFTSYKSVEEKSDSIVRSWAIEWLDYRIFLKNGKVTYFRRLHKKRDDQGKINATPISLNIPDESAFKAEEQTITHKYLQQRDRRWCIFSGMADFHAKKCVEFPY